MEARSHCQAAVWVGILFQTAARLVLVNAGLDAFTRAAALGMPRGVRINVVSPPWVRETLRALGRDPTPGLSASVVAKAYVDSVEGETTGERLDPRDYVTADASDSGS